MVDPVASARALKFPAYRGISANLEHDVLTFNERAAAFRERLENATDREQRVQLLAELVELWGERETVAEKAAAELATVTAAVEATTGKVERDTIDRFASVGISVDGMPAATLQPEMARRQLEVLLRFDPKYRQATEELADAKIQWNGADSQRGHCQRKAAQVAALPPATPTKQLAGALL
jgi:hypothetical protein